MNGYIKFQLHCIGGCPSRAHLLSGPLAPQDIFRFSENIFTTEICHTENKLKYHTQTPWYCVKVKIFSDPLEIFASWK
jgi:hypothetical protein